MPGLRGRTVVVAAAAGLSLLASGCAGWGGGPGGGGANSINVLMVNNPQMVDLQKLTADNFTKETGIRVNFTVLPENDVRDKISQEFSSQAGQYDVASLSNFEIPIYARASGSRRWTATSRQGHGVRPGRHPQADDDVADRDDGKVYGEPFYGESSFLMYRKDVLAAKGITMPAKPTWQQVADIAAKVDGAKPGMAGICLRGQPGWGQVFAPLTTVVNTFGGTWFDKDWTPQVDAPRVHRPPRSSTSTWSARTARRAPRRPGSPSASTTSSRATSAMWYDATSAAGSLEAADSPVKGKIGYAPAPVVQDRQLRAGSTPGRGASSRPAEEGQRLEVHLLGVQQGVRGARRPAARLVQGAGRQARLDLREPRLPQGGSAFAEPTKAAIERPTRTNPGVQPRPAIGIQFVDIPEFPDLGTQVVAGRQLGDRRADDASTRP